MLECEMPPPWGRIRGARLDLQAVIERGYPSPPVAGPRNSDLVERFRCKSVELARIMADESRPGKPSTETQVLTTEEALQYFIELFPGYEKMRARYGTTDWLPEV